MIILSINKIDALRNGVDVAEKVTPSVLALAIVSGVKVAALAKVLADSDSISDYRTELALALSKASVDRAVEDEKEARKADK